MLTSGMPELSSSEDVQYVRDALMPGATDIEAIISFTRSELYNTYITVTMVTDLHVGALKPVWDLRLHRLISSYIILLK